MATPRRSLGCFLFNSEIRAEINNEEEMAMGLHLPTRNLLDFLATLLGKGEEEVIMDEPLQSCIASASCGS
jgi:hypothetical protein